MLPCLPLLVGCAIAMPPPKIEVMILGTFHMAGGGDMFNPNVKDITEPRRQKEVEEVVVKLAAFKPTRVCIEAPAGSSNQQQRFEKYLGPGLELTRNEIDQVAFRLAKRCGLKEVSPVDWKKDMDIEGLLKHAGEIGQGDVAKRMMDRMTNEILPQMGVDKMETKSLLQIYSEFNTPEGDRLGHSIYMDMLAVGKNDDYMGADMVAGWYERNLKIATNIARIAKPGDRVFVLMGAGHCKLLRQYLSEMDGYEIVWPSKYLK